MDFVIAVDGSAASGKGTLAATLAADYALPHLDTGLLYRAVGRMMWNAGLPPSDAQAAERMARNLDTGLLDSPSLRDEGMGEAASQVAAHPGVRAALLDFQQAFARQPGGAVLDGRDIGTVVAPWAVAKLYVDAHIEERARRRVNQSIQLNGMSVPLDAMVQDLARRDARDSGRADAPMVRAPDAVLLDTTEMSIAAAADAARRIVEQARVRWLAGRSA